MKRLFISGFHKIRHFQPSYFLNGIQIPEVSSVKVLGFLFDSSLTWQKYIENVLNRGKQRLSQLYHCHSLFGHEGMATFYKSWIYPVFEYGSILYCRAALSHHLNRLDLLQARVEKYVWTYISILNCSSQCFNFGSNMLSPG